MQQGFLGAGAVAIGLVLAAPFAGIEGPSVSFPSISAKPGIEKAAKKPGAVIAPMKSKDPTGYKLDVSGETAEAKRAARAEAEAAKKAAAEKLAEEKAAAKAAAKAAKEEGESRYLR